MKVLLNDGLEKEGVKLFEDFNIEADTQKRSAEELVDQIGNFDALIVRSATKVTREVIEAGVRGNLKIIGRAGVGFDNIDVEAASENGVVVKTAPYGNTNAVAELTLGLMLSVSRNIPQAHQALKSCVWEKKKLKGTELSYKTLGIIGCGKIGQRVADLARRGFDMDIIGFDICPCPESKIKYVTKDQLLSKADYITIHTGGQTAIIGEKELAKMKPTAYIINTSRGPNINESDLYAALKEKKIAGAALDVYCQEPKGEGSEFKNKLAELPNVVLSSHLGASTVEAQRETSLEIARVVSGYLMGGDFTNAINAGESLEHEEKTVYPLFIHHRDVPGVFANIDRVLAENDINIRANYSRQVGKSGFAISVYVVHTKVSAKTLEVLKKIENVCDVKI
ncbi:MAG: ACT domain-containing protein [Candidatus Bathyarchaeota archaeon]|nr:ACT domain-containing protein [Candidatus Bathyarchaeota archaeon]